MTLTKSFVRVSFVTSALLLVPWVAMQFTSEVNWSLSDFIIMGVLLLSTGAALEMVASKRGPLGYRLAAGGAVLTALLLIWVNLAVGFIGSGPNPANLLCGAVPVVGLVGAIAGRFRPRGMASAMVATALTQLLVPVLAVLLWQMPVKPQEWMGSAVFALLWLASAWLFRRASLNQAPEPGA